MITTYEILQADYARLAEFKWASLIVDEVGKPGLCFRVAAKLS
jgi:hypothetical protein